MRLIEADVLIKSVNGNVCVTDSVKTYIKASVDNVPTVDAIPIDWIREWYKAPITEESKKVCERCEYDVIEWMLAEWHERKEE